METLKTLNGSKIQRSKYGVGKLIGGKIYVHKNYADRIIPTPIWKQAKEIVSGYTSSFKYNCVCYSPKENIVRFDEAPDFDSVREPHPGKMIAVNLNTHEIIESNSDMIWHHKWLWVDDDYCGFNVQVNWQWSKTWLQYITHPSGSKSKWAKELEKYNLI